MNNSKKKFDALVIVTKVPIPKFAKTKLYPYLTFNEAAELCGCFLKDLINRVKTIKNIDLFVSYIPKIGKNFFLQFFKESNIFLQRKRKLGNKIFEIFNHLFNKGYKNIVIIASDSPDLPLKFIKLSFNALKKRRKRITIGPSVDGGFYLIGTNHTFKKNIFKEIDWGKKKIVIETVRVAKKNEFNICILPFWYDIDEFINVIKLAKRILFRPGCRLPNTKHFLMNKIFAKINDYFYLR